MGQQLFLHLDQVSRRILHILLGADRFFVQRPWAIAVPVSFFFNSTEATPTTDPIFSTLASISISSYDIHNNNYINQSKYLKKQ